MRDFERKPGRLHALSLPARLVYSAFLLFTLTGLALSAGLLDDMVGVDLHGTGAYYAGEPEVTPSTAPTGDTGPAFELPPEADAAPMATPMSRRKLLEVSHFHLFSMPVYLLILSHLFMLGRSRKSLKVAVIAASSVGTALHILAPWAAAGSWPAANLLYASSGILLGVGLSWMCLVPLWEMWSPAPKT
ncbi:MAG: hypothetical protein GXP55_19480 [Deltaproteobacteria bacterium]|nr:hypothetical protein [Deltaproteobacteria bacterium]